MLDQRRRIRSRSRSNRDCNFFIIQILSIKLEEEAKQVTGLDQYSYSRFAKSFEIIPRILAENAGLNSNDIISKLIVANKTSPHGIQIITGNVESIANLEVYDHLRTK